MDVIKLINKALSDDDIGMTLGAGASIILYSELRHIDDLDDLLTKDMDYCIILYEDRPDRGHWTALSRFNGIYTSTSIRMVISPTSRSSRSILR